MVNFLTSDHSAEKDLSSLPQLDVDSQQTMAIEGSTTSTQPPEKAGDSLESDIDSLHDEYPTAFKLAMIVVALVLAMFLVSQNKTLSLTYTNSVAQASLDMVSMNCATHHMFGRMN